MAKTVRTALLWAIPLTLTSADALAWGLHTHVYFAQLLLWAVPLLDPELRRAVLRHPALAMAGACLPDLALVGPRIGTEAFAVSHRWDTVHELLADGGDSEARALAVGYASHLLVDVIAHHHFVPAHEKLWLDVPWLTHVAVEWAMDAHIGRHAFAAPAEVLAEARGPAAAFAARHFRCSEITARRAVDLLTRADHGLRRSRLPQALYRAFRFDRRLEARFDGYIQATGERLGQLNRVLAREAPAWEAELSCPHTKRSRLEPFSRHELRGRLPLPMDLFVPETA